MLWQLLFNGLITGSVYALVALGFGLIYGTTRFFHFAHGAVYAWGAYFTYFLVRWLAFPLFVSIFLSIFFTTLLGVLIEIGIYRRLRRLEATGLVLLLSSLGIFVVLQNIISIIFGDDTKTLRTGVVQEGIKVLGARITPIQIAIISISCILFIFSTLILKYTKIGKAVRAVANDPELAQVSGIESERVILFTFAIGSALAAIAAILISFDIDMTPMMGFNALLMGVVAIIIGGVGSLPGAALGGLFLGLAQNLGALWISSQWQDAIAFLILLCFLFFRPSGFFGRRVQKVEV